MSKSLFKASIAMICTTAVVVFGSAQASGDECVMCEQVKPKIVEEIVPVSDCLNEIAVVVYKDSCKTNCGDFPVVVRKSNCCSGSSACDSK